MMDGIEGHDTVKIEQPDDALFSLWRAVFALVHVDGEVSSEEERYIDSVMERFSFSNEQQDIVRDDLKKQGSVVTLFQNIESLDYRRQFFVLARTVVWCDGFLHDDERQALEDVQKSLGDDIAQYSSELRWLDRKPVPYDGVSGETNEERMMQTVIYQMLAFLHDIKGR